MTDINSFYNKKRDDRSLAISSKIGLEQVELETNQSIDFSLSYLFGNGVYLGILDIISLLYKEMSRLTGREADTARVGNLRISPYIKDSMYSEDGSLVNYDTFKERLVSHLVRRASETSDVDTGYYTGIADVNFNDKTADITTFGVNTHLYNYTEAHYTNLINIIKAGSQAPNSDITAGQTDITEVSDIEDAVLKVYRQVYKTRLEQLKLVSNKTALIASLTALETFFDNLILDLTSISTFITGLATNDRFSMPSISGELTGELSTITTRLGDLNRYKTVVSDAKTYFNTGLVLKVDRLAFNSTFIPSSVSRKVLILPIGSSRRAYVSLVNRSEFSPLFTRFHLTFTATSKRALANVVSSGGDNNFYISVSFNDTNYIIYFTYVGSGAGSDTSLTRTPSNSVLSGKTGIGIVLDGTVSTSISQQVSEQLDLRTDFVSKYIGNDVYFRDIKTGSLSVPTLTNAPSGITVNSNLAPYVFSIGTNDEVIEVNYNETSDTTPSALRDKIRIQLGLEGLGVQASGEFINYTHPYDSNIDIVNGLTGVSGSAFNASDITITSVNSASNTDSINDYIVSLTDSKSLVKLKIDTIGSDTQGLLDNTSYARAREVEILSTVENGLPTTTTPLSKIKKWYVFWLKELMKKVGEGSYFVLSGIALGKVNTTNLLRESNRALDEILDSSHRSIRFNTPSIIAVYNEDVINTGTLSGKTVITWNRDIGGNKYDIIKRKITSVLELTNDDWVASANTTIRSVGSTDIYEDNFTNITSGDVYVYRVKTYDATDSVLGIVRNDTVFGEDSSSFQSNVFEETGIAIDSSSASVVILSEANPAIQVGRFFILKDAGGVSLGYYEVSSVEGNRIGVIGNIGTHSGGSLHLIEGMIKIV